MGLLRKLKFWKKPDDNFGLGDDLPMDQSTDPAATDHLGLNTQTPGAEEFPDHSLGLDHGLEAGTGGVDNPTAFKEQSQFQQETQQANEAFHQQPLQQNKEFDLISSKLDTIKAELDAMNQRLQKIEKIAEESEKETKKAVW